MRRQVRRRSTADSIAGSAAGFTAEFVVHSLAVLWLGLCLLVHLMLACAPYACAPYIGADTGAPDSTEIFRDIVGLLGLP